jgi:hypothetical protein
LTSSAMNYAEMELSNDTMVNYCDYYEIGKGYQFTQVDSGIGLIINLNLEGGMTDQYWMNYNSSSNSSWSWTQLASLINSYSES